MRLTTQMREIMTELKQLGSEVNITSFKRLGITADSIYGVIMPQLRKYAKTIHKNKALAMSLFNTCNREAQIVASLIVNIEELSIEDMHSWATQSTSWDVVDAVCMNLFWKFPQVDTFIDECYQSEIELAKRYAPVLMVCCFRHKKDLDDKTKEKYLCSIMTHISDTRNYVLKAHSWALRELCKKYPDYKIKVILELSRYQGSKDSDIKWLVHDVMKKLSKRRLSRQNPQ